MMKEHFLVTKICFKSFDLCAFTFISVTFFLKHFASHLVSSVTVVVNSLILGSKNMLKNILAMM